MLIRFGVIGILLLSFSAQAGELQVSRYGSLSPVATSEQKDLLSIIVTISFNRNINTVGQALDHLLLRSGYQMADLSISDPVLPVLLTQPLPDVHKVLGPIHLDNALKTLAGPAWDLIVDPVHRLISFELLDKYNSESDKERAERLQQAVNNFRASTTMATK
jgi:type IV pili sensor histidine kinase/response regulator